MGKLVSLDSQKKKDTAPGNRGRFVQIGDTSRIGANSSLKLGSAETRETPAVTQNAPTVRKTAEPSQSRQQWTATGGGRKSTKSGTENVQKFKGSSWAFEYDPFQNTERMDSPTLAQRVGNTVKGGAKGSLASNANSMTTLYDMGQGGRSERNQEFLDEAAHNLERAKLDMNAMLDANRKTPGSWSDADIQSQRQILADAQKQYDAMAKVINENVQQKATKASYQLADEIQQSSAQDIEKAKEGLSGFGRALVDAGASLTQTGLDAGANALLSTPGNMGAFAFRAFGGGTQQARQDNPDSTLAQQVLFGSASAAKEVFTEKMFNIALPFAKAYGGGALDDVVERGIRQAADKLAKTDAGKRAMGAALTFGAGATSEGLEELIGDWMEWQLPRIYGGDVATAGETLSDSLYDFLVGAMSGAMGGVISPNTYHYDLGTVQTAQQGAQERAAAAEGMDAAPVQRTAQTAQSAAQDTAPTARMETPAARETGTMDSRTMQNIRESAAAVRNQFARTGETLGESGKKAFQAAYQQGTDRGSYAREFLQAYHAGMTNQENPNSSSAISFAAYAAGKNDAAASLASEKRAAQFAKTAGTDSGLVYDDYVSREMDSTIAGEVNTVAKALGVRVRMVDQVLGGQGNGQISGSEILLAKDARNPVLQVVGHEWTHRVQELAPEQYRTFRDAVGSMQDVQAAAQSLMEQYNAAGIETSYEQALDEATANYAGEMIENSDVLDDFIRKHSGDRTLLQKLRDAIHEIVGKLTGKAKKQAQTVEGKLQAAFEAASKQAENLNSKNTATEGGETRFSVKELDNGQYYVKADRQVLKGDNSAEWGKQLENFINNEIRHNRDVVIPTTDGNVIRLTERSAYKLSDRKSTNLQNHQKKELSTERYLVKENAAAHIDEIIMVGEFKSNSDDIGGHHKNDIGEDGFNTYTAYFEDHDGQYYRIQFTSALNGDVETAYSIGDIQKRKKPATGNGSSTQESGALNGSKLPTDTVTQDTGGVNRKYSLKTDSTGRELSVGQQEYFRDSEVVDEGGHLKPVYHATYDEFTVFDRSKLGTLTDGNATDENWAATSHIGFWFNTEDLSKRAGLGNRAEEVYLNITAPYDAGSLESLAAQMSEYDGTPTERGADFADWLRKNGYDGVVIRDEEFGGTSYIALEPEQIKRVTNQNPTNNSDIRYSLKSVPAVQPKTDDWRPGATFAEVQAEHPTLFALDADEADARNPTQITGTVKSYRKIYDALEAEGFDGTILDASSGLGYGTRAGREEYGFNVDDIEPFPDSKYQPKYTDYSTLNKTYDVIISNAVLNVIPQDLRDAMVVKIGEMLNPGGRAFINVRGTDVKNAGSKVAINDVLMEYFISNTGSYQKGFTSKELVAYLKDALGDGFTVEPTKKFGAVSAIVTRDADGGKSRFSLKDYSDVEQRDHRKKAIEFFGKTYNWNETGYLTPAGTKLDFSGRHEGAPGGYRTVDHRDIRDAISEDYGGDDYSGSMVQFMSEGNIRISPESGGINLSVEPTKSQMDALSDFIGENRGEVILDIDTPDGQTVSSTEYPKGTHASKVLNDIKAYFKDGTKPRVSELAQFLSLKGTENAQELAALKRENETLRERVEYWKGQTKRTQRVTTDKKAVAKAADALVKDYGAEISGSDIDGDLQSLYDYIASGRDGKDELTYTEARRRADAIAERIAESAVAVDDSTYQEYAGLRKFLRDTKLTLSAEDAAGITDFAEFRKGLFGKLKIGKGEHTNVDQVYAELSERYPEFFNEQRETNISDQVERIADVANRLYAVTEYNPFEGDMGQAVASISNDIFDRFFDLPQTKKTFADRRAEQVQEARTAGKQAAGDAFLAGQMAQGRQDARRLRSTAGALARERTRRAEQVQALRERYQEKDANRRDSQKRRELRAKITRHASALSQKLLQPTDTQHIPEEMRAAVAKVLESINQESSPNTRSFTVDPVTGERVYKEPGTPTNRTVAFQNLKEQYQAIARDGDMVVDPSLFGDSDSGVTGGFDAVIKMGDTRLADLTTEQLQTMWNVVKSVEHSVTTAGKTLASEKFATTRQFADALRTDGMMRRRKLGSNVAISLETPYTFFAHFGKTGKDIYRLLRNAQDSQEIMARDVAEKVQRVLGDTEKRGLRSNAVTAMNEETHHFTTTEGKELTLTTAQAMELYLLSERKQAQAHLLEGGIVQPEIRVPGEPKIPRGTDVIQLSAKDIQAIASVLTPEQIRIADGLQKLTTGVLADYGNTASMKAYGYRKFTETDYWPIRSAKETLYSSQEKDSGNVRSIKNIGMAQAVKPNAKTPLNIRGVFDTFADHASDMIDYAAWLCPMEDVNRLYNFRFRDGEGHTVQTVKGFLDEKGGEGSKEYWQKLMGDIQNGIKAKDFEPLTDKFAKGIGRFKGAAVGANVRVVIQQPTAFFRASFVLNPADMAKGLKGGVTKGSGWQKAVEYSPIAMRKDVGSFDISSPYTLNERFYGQEGVTSKLNKWAGKAAGGADAITWGALWNACEWQVKREKPNLRAGSKAFYSAVNEVFTDMIDQTQVVDGILQRSNIMRGKSDLAKQATSFMGEPIMSLNVFMRAWDNLRYEGNPAKRSKAIKTVGRATAALLVTNAVNAMVQSVADAMRDDDPDKDYWEKYWAALTGVAGNEKTMREILQHVVLEGNLGSNINPAGNIPFIKDILSLVQGYSVSRTDMQVFSDIVSASKTFIDSIGGNGKKTRTEALSGMFAACAKLYGLPVANIRRDVNALIRTVAQATGSIPIQYEFEKLTYNIGNASNKNRFMDLMYRALEQGDLTTYEHIRKELKDYMAVDSTSVDSGMRSRMEKRQEEDEDYRLPAESARLIGAKEAYSAEKEDSFSENDLSADDYIVYGRRKSELYGSVESELKSSQAFQQFTGEQKDKALNSAATYAKKIALQETAGGQYEISDKWILKAQEAQKKYGIAPGVYVALKTQVSDMESVKDKNGEAIPNSKGLLIMQAVYNTPGLTEKQRNALFEYLGVGKSIRHYNRALVNEKVRKNARLAGK
nr:MAG TPA: PolyVal ADP-Ribosyltransferase [Caudoviricetes sp.]